MERFALQRRLACGRAQWRTVQRFELHEAGVVLESAQRIGNVGDPISWRVVIDDDFQNPVLEWDRNQGWREVRH